jgi:thioredoxin-related protein
MRFLIGLLFSASLLFSFDTYWMHSYDKALELAKKENKKVYMLITSDNCRWCRKFENTTLQEEATIARLNSKYILLHVDRDRDIFPEKFIRKGVPRHYVISENGNVIYTFLGYWNHEDFFSFMNEAEQRFSNIK